MISIRGRLLLSLGLGAGLIFVTCGFALDRALHAELVRRHDAALLARAWGLANALQADDGAIEVEATHGLEVASDSRLAPVLFEVWHEDGRSVGRAEALGASHLPRPDVVGEEPIHADLELSDGTAARCVEIYVPLYAEGGGLDGADATLADMTRHQPAAQPIEYVTIALAQDLREVDATMQGFRRIGAIVGLLALGASAALIAWSLRRSLAPLVAIGERARTLDANSLHVGLGSEALPRELEPIRARLEELLTRLHEAFERERRFSASVAHELRTPIAELRMLAEVELLGGAEPEHTHSLQTVLAISHRMQGLLDALNLLRRVEAGSSTMEVESIRLVDAVNDALGAVGVSASGGRVSVRADLPEPFEIRTHRELFSCALSNLIGNALDHSPPHSAVELFLRDAGGRCVVEIANEAPQLEEADLGHMFEPLWRKDESRSDSEHAGLGLPISRAIAQQLGMGLTTSLSESGRFAVVLECPPR